ncbi:MAG: T9SS type A sorting domain-containing protein [Candidatus Marinimicrobia bacterium]|jgi:hypothetical protein|nr:T9SS type A sorting domain-containing protein [Candidatus Neomarinimicrobiota bacterium]MBT3829061.1 T9SS type A sorting domain-containing protein [Candidatus Neomarinimicrobiota bacterium]MBT4281356.1 T9SS type A sorting domain-containing protein [Candidatus Neomarinimicrobiota bacterium]MBT4569910.1 T9SS type A sorting domain-containing protein [Candidatus Neomarinimicrobiota bacterium]MBT4796593.1 T9SS type A sorting domain-containing protein [Candidatus Neomarinimicrobiota bacterium]
MLNKLMTILLILSLQPTFATSGYNAAGDFSLDYSLNAHGDANFSTFTALGAQSVLAGMDFDGDSLYEILFSIDETLAPGGPDPGYLGVYLYEADGNGGYNHVWHFITPDPGNSLPGLFYGDIDSDGLSEIYFGVPPASGSNDNTWGTYIFEQQADLTFPATATLLFQYGMTFSDNFRPAGFEIADLDGDGNMELCTVDRAVRRLSIDELDGSDFSSLSTFTNEYLDTQNLGGGSVYNLDAVDYDGDGNMEVWVNTWNNFSMTVFEAVQADSYKVAVDLNEIFQDGDPASFRRNGFAFHDINGDSSLQAWFPMTNGKLYYLESVPDSVGGVDSLKASHFHEVLTFGSRNRGSDSGDIDGDGDFDIIATTGTKETVVRMEFTGSDPTDANDYEVTTIFESIGDPADRYYPLDISDNDLDGDGELEVVLTNLYANDPTQPQILVLDYDKFSFDSGGDNPEHLAANWSISAIAEATDGDSLFNTASNPRSVIGGMDMDGDGKREVIATQYAGSRVVVFEYDVANNVFDQVWASDTTSDVLYGYAPRTVTVADLDADGKQEIVFHSPSTAAPGYHIYEWDGVVGSDNYGATFSAICQIEVDTCCAGDGQGSATYGSGYRGRHDAIEIMDVDGDGQQEILAHIRDSAPKGTLIISLNAGDDIVHNSGGGLETWNTEFWVDRSHYSGGSPLHALPADLDGDGKYEIVNHTWNNFHFYNLTADSADSYSAPDSGTGWYKATSNDQYSIWGGYAHDIDSDGNDEAYFASYGSWGVGSGDVYAMDYSPGDSVLNVDENHVKMIAPNIGQFIGDVGYGYDGSARKSIFVGRTVPNITALEYIGTDPLSPSSYFKKIIYWGEHDVVNTTVTLDSTDAPDTTYASSPWGFAAKIETNWGGDLLDFDNDGQKELLVGFQSVDDSLTTTVKTLNMDSVAIGVTHYDDVVTSVVNPKRWSFIIIENGSAHLGVNDDPIRFIRPEEYILAQNYPNPFNPNTVINYTLPINREVSVKVYNITGQLVRTLVDNELISAGSHKVVWNGKNDLGRKVATGAYIYTLEWAGMKKAKMMTLLK